MTKEELENCIEACGTAVYSFCVYLTGSRQEADDLYQDTFLKAVELMGQIEGQGEAPKNYLLSIAANIWKNRRRKLAWRKRIADIGFFPVNEDGELQEPAGGAQARECYGACGATPEEACLRREQDQAVRAAIGGLPRKLRVVALLHYMEGCSVGEIAKMLKVPEGTVKSRLYHARKQLKRELEDVLT